MNNLFINKDFARTIRTANEFGQDNSLIESEQKKMTEPDNMNNRAVRSAACFDDEFLAFFLHELRTPLNSIIGWARLLRQGLLYSAEINKAVESINRNGDLLNSLIEDLLDFSRIANGKMEFQTAKVDLRRVVENIIEDFTPQAITKNIVLISSFEKESSEILADEKRLRQIVGNILTNALKFTPSGGYIMVDLSHVENQVRLEIKDSGVGIEPQSLPFIFERFWQDEANKKQNDGLGLGLAVARFLVQAQGGSISACSDGLNQGTAFIVQLPLAR